AGRHDDDRGPDGQARAAPAVGLHHVRGHAGRALAGAVDARDPAVGGDPGAEAERARDVRHQRPPLGAGRAAEDAGVAARAVGVVADVLDDLPALGLGARAQELVVAADGLGVLVRRRDHALDALEGQVAHALDAVLAGPALEHLVGRAPRHAAVDHRR